MLGRILYSPRALNSALGRELDARGWQKHKVQRVSYFGQFVWDLECRGSV